MSKVLKILVVEDNKTNQVMARAIITRLKFDCDIASNGRECLEKIYNNSYDFILMDCHMPEMDGFAATAAIRKHEQEAACRDSTGQPRRSKIIAMTADTEAEVQKQCLECGMNDFVSKPVEASTITYLVDKWLGKTDQGVKDHHFGQENAEATTDPLPVFDRAILMRRSMDNQEIFNSITAVFIRGIPALMEKLEKAIEAQDALAVKLHSHTIKGSAGTAAALAMQDIAKSIQMDAAQGDLSCVADKFKKLADSFREYPKWVG